MPSNEVIFILKTSQYPKCTGILLYLRIIWPEENLSETHYAFGDGPIIVLSVLVYENDGSTLHFSSLRRRYRYSMSHQISFGVRDAHFSVFQPFYSAKSSL